MVVLFLPLEAVSSRKDPLRVDQSSSADMFSYTSRKRNRCLFHNVQTRCSSSLLSKTNELKSEQTNKTQAKINIKYGNISLLTFNVFISITTRTSLYSIYS